MYISWRNKNSYDSVYQISQTALPISHTHAKYYKSDNTFIWFFSISDTKKCTYCIVRISLPCITLLTWPRKFFHLKNDSWVGTKKEAQKSMKIRFLKTIIKWSQVWTMRNGLWDRRNEKISSYALKYKWEKLYRNS